MVEALDLARLQRHQVGAGAVRSLQVFVKRPPVACLLVQLLMETLTTHTGIAGVPLTQLTGATAKTSHETE